MSLAEALCRSTHAFEWKGPAVPRVTPCGECIHHAVVAHEWFTKRKGGEIA